jgi:hypothetical protein
MAKTPILEESFVPFEETEEAAPRTSVLEDSFTPFEGEPEQPETEPAIAEAVTESSFVPYEESDIQQKPTPSLVGAVGRSVAGEIIPSVTGTMGALTGAKLGAPGGIPGMAVGTLLGGVAGYYAGESAQKGVARSVVGDEEYDRFQLLRQADREKFPIATTGAEILTGLGAGIKTLEAGRQFDVLGKALRPATPTRVQTEPPPPTTQPAKIAGAPYAPPEIDRPVKVIAKTAKRELERPDRTEAYKKELTKQPGVIRNRVAVGRQAEALRDTETDVLRNRLNELNVKPGILSGPEATERDGIRAILSARDFDSNPAGAAENFSAFVRSTSQAGLTLRNAQEYIKTPAGYLASVQSAVKAYNPNRVLQPTDQQKITSLFTAKQAAQREADQALKFLRDPKSTGFLTDDAAMAVDAAQARLATVGRELAVFERGLIPRKFLQEVYPEAIQTSGLLSPVSLIKNPVYNIVRSLYQGLAIRPIANAMDSIYVLATKTRAQIGGRLQGKTGADLKKFVAENAAERVRIGNLTTARAKLGGQVRGLAESFKALGSGVSKESVLYGEGFRGSNPLRNFTQALTGKNMVTNDKGRVLVIDRVRKAFDGLVGLAAEPTGRLLGVGDLLFRRGEMARLVAERALLKGKSAKEALVAAKYPFAKELEEVAQEAAESVFQQDTLATRAVNSLVRLGYQIPIIGPGLTRSLLPFAKTPVNVVDDALPVVYPPLGFAKAVYYANKGDRRKAQQMAASGIVGTATVLAAAYLRNLGLITPQISKSEKRRDLQYGIEYPGSLNVSGLMRHLNGQDHRPQTGDLYQSYETMGYLGAVFGTYTKISDLDPNQTTTDTLLNYSLYGIPFMANYTLNQTFLKSTAELLTAISQERYDKVLENIFNTAGSPFTPAGLVAINRASRKYLPDPKTEKGELDTFINVMKTRVSPLIPMGKKLPPKRGMWGEPILQTPKGVDPIVYNLMDPFRTRSYNPSPETVFLYRMYTAARKELGESEANKLLPSRPDQDVKISGVVYRLNTKQIGEMHFEVGQRQKDLLREAMDSDSFMSAPPDLQRAQVRLAMERGASQGRKAYIEANSDLFQPKKIKP